jgi:hypothetical protein
LLGANSPPRAAIPVEDVKNENQPVACQGHGRSFSWISRLTREDAKVVRGELKARWAFAEFRSERFRGKYAHLSPERIRNGVAFWGLDADERSHLVWMLDKYRAPLAPELDRADLYECQAWTKERFGRVHTIAVLGPNRNENVSFLSFIATPPFDDSLDPRVEAGKIPVEAPFVQTEPVIVLPYGEIELLLDGYLRGLLFMRSREKDGRILVWVPARS